MRILRLLVIALVLGGLLLPTQGRGGQAPLPDPVEGSRLFVSKGCVLCHAVDGEGGKIGPDLGRVSTGRSLLGIAAVMWNHTPIMTERIKEVRATRPKLKPEEMANLFAFLTYTGYFDAAGDPKRGADVFRDRGCARCHAGTTGQQKAGYRERQRQVELAETRWQPHIGVRQHYDRLNTD